MSTEETELTFIRCPSCRSLVPAVATRCRMCGYSFEANAESEESHSEDEDSAAKSRVRQRTISATPEEVAELSASEGTEEPSKDSSESFNAESTVLESFSAAILEPVGEPIDEFEVAAPHEVNQTVSTDFDAALVEPEVQADPESSPEQEESSSAVEGEEEAPSEKKRKRRRRRKKKDTTSLADGEISMNGTSSTENQPALASASASSQQDATSVGEKTSSDRLIGWLVNYVDENNPSSSELRSRRFFISSEKLRENDLLFTGAGVSAPHCLVAAHDDGTVVLQDLMSEGGTSIRRNGESSFTKISDATTLAHGDTLKVGDNELLLCLIPARK